MAKEVGRRGTGTVQGDAISTFRKRTGSPGTMRNSLIILAPSKHSSGAGSP